VNDIEKLRVLLPHWLEHNQEHASEFGGWADKAAAAGAEGAAEKIRRAAEAMQDANDALQAALDDLGGAGHTHHHGHDH
jgi:hypothetical protein